MYQSLPPASDRPAPPARAAVVALGSPIQGDDGAGAAALHVLESEWELPRGVEALDLGTPGLYLAELIRDFDALVFLDAVRAVGSPGEVVVVRYGVGEAPPPLQRLTPHTPDIGEALATLAFEEKEPDATLVGVVPARLAVGTELSDAVRGVLGKMAALAVAELRRLGFVVRRRASAPADGRAWALVQPFHA